MAEPRSLWVILHDGLLERVRIEDGLVSLVVDVPHVREHAKLHDDARFCVRARGLPSLWVAQYHAPSVPPPAGHERPAAVAWRALGTLRSIDWDAFAASLAEPDSELEILDPLLVPSGERVALTLGCEHRHSQAKYDSVELRLEAASITFAHEGGEEIPLDAFEQMGRAYWEAWRAENDARRRAPEV